MAVKAYLGAVLGAIERKQARSLESKRSLGFLLIRYLLAVTLQGLLFWCSAWLRKEPEVAFAMVYLLLSIVSTLFLGFGPGIVSAVCAAFSVNYHYILKQQPNVIAHSVSFLVAFIVLYSVTVSICWLLIEAVRRQIKAKQIAENAMFVREELLQVIAHDLRQPLAAAMLQIELVNRMERDHPDARSLGDNALKSLKRMDRLVLDLLDSAKAGHGTLKLNFETVNFKEVIDQAISVVSESAKQKRVNLRVSFAANSTTEHTLSSTCYDARIDSDRMIRVMTNLLGNSLKFTPPGGEILIRLLEPDVNSLQVSVSDTGPGILKEEASALFSKNWQSRKTSHLGNGLGLYICKGIIEAHQGEIHYDVNSVSGTPHGATFTFSVPKSWPPVSDLQTNPSKHTRESRNSNPKEYREYNGG